jgi:hypothetical protein
MTTAYSGDGITFPDNSVQATAPRVGMVNRIINGDMRIDQRNAGGSVTQTTANLYGIDRFQTAGSLTSKFTSQQSTTAPAGFINSTVITSSAATPVGASDFYMFSQWIEGLNVSDLAWGTASAATVTLSFWVRSSLTGTFGGSIQNSDNSRSYPYSYTISSANTWEKKTVTVAGDTSGTWLTTNGTGIKVRWGLGAGSTFSGTVGSWAAANYYSATGATSVVGTDGATFYATGVQLEKGSTATDFEYVDYGRQLQMCQRYFEKQGMWGQLASGGYGQGGGFTWTLKVNMRAIPTITFSNQTIGSSVATYGPQETGGCGMGSSGNANGQFQFTATASAEL